MPVPLINVAFHAEVFENAEWFSDGLERVVWKIALINSFVSLFNPAHYVY